MKAAFFTCGVNRLFWALPTTSITERWTKYSTARKPKSAGYDSTAATGPPAAPAEAKKMNNSTLPNEQWRPSNAPLSLSCIRRRANREASPPSSISGVYGHTLLVVRDYNGQVKVFNCEGSGPLPRANESPAGANAEVTVAGASVAKTTARAVAVGSVPRLGGAT